MQITSRMSEAAANMVALSEKNREDAYKNARRIIAGDLKLPDEPQLADFQKKAVRPFPNWFIYSMIALCVVMLVASYLPSAMRLHAVAFIATSAVIAHVFSQYVAALCIVMLAETGQIIFTLAGTASAKDEWQKWLFWIGAAICTLIALIGNGIAVFEPPVGIASPKDAFEVFTNPTVATALRFAFVMLETFAPPILVLIVSSVLKSIIMDAISTHHQSRAAYRTAHDAWSLECQRLENAHEQAQIQAHNHHSWLRTVANELREALRRTNHQRTKTLTALTNEDWLVLVRREMAHEEWYSQAEAGVETQMREQAQAQANAVQQAQAQAAEAIARADALAQRLEAETQERERLKRVAENAVQQAQDAAMRLTSQTDRRAAPGRRAGNPTGEHANTVKEIAPGRFVASCPKCDERIEKDTYRGAINALNAHKRHRHPEAAIAAQAS